ncbi:P-loop containing nucleoside triphosphate hydrolase protein [Haematococcus lacustris]
MSRRDVLVRAPTGSGKTLAYLVPMVADLAGQEPRLSRADGTFGLVLAPTRELSLQIQDVALQLMRKSWWLVAGVLIGGENRNHEKSRLRKGLSLVSATPGRLLDHLENTNCLHIGRLRWLVLDEADRLLDLGFEVKLRQILALLDARQAAAAGLNQGSTSHAGSTAKPRPRTTALLSATLHAGLSGLATVSLHDPVAAGFTLSKDKAGSLLLGGASSGSNPASGTPGAVETTNMTAGSGSSLPGGLEQFQLPSQLRQSFMEVEDKQRLVTLAGLLRQKLMGGGRGGGGAGLIGQPLKAAGHASAAGSAERRKAVVFLSSCDGVELHWELLGRCWHSASGGPLLGREVPLLKLHGDMPQAQRTSSFVTFSEAPCAVLLCTDVAARGLDFPDVTVIIQYDVPGAPSEYVHRVGRTARIGHAGEAVLMLMPHERPYVDMLASRGIQLHEVSAEGPLRWLPQVAGAMEDSGALTAGRNARGAASRAPSSREAVKPMALAFNLQRKLMQVVGQDTQLRQLAADAFRSFTRAYAAHTADVKKVFHVRNLHLGHIAFAHALKDTPTMLGSSGSATERKRKRVEELASKQRVAKKALYKKAAAIS